MVQKVEQVWNFSYLESEYPLISVVGRDLIFWKIICNFFSLLLTGKIHNILHINLLILGCIYRGHSLQFAVPLTWVGGF